MALDAQNAILVCPVQLRDRRLMPTDIYGGGRDIQRMFNGNITYLWGHLSSKREKYRARIMNR